MSNDSAKLLEVRKKQLASMSEMVDSLRDDNENLKNDNKLLTELRNKLAIEE